MTEKA